MNGSGSNLFSAMRGACGRLLAAPLGAALLALAACNGTALVTLTSTASQDTFLAYRVGLVSVQLQASSGKAGLTILPASTTVDFAQLTEVSEVLGAAAVAKGSYTSAVITLDYSSAQIVYDDGSIDGVSLNPVDASGQALGQIQLTVNLDPSDSFSVSSNRTSHLALDFNLAASNVVDLTNKKVTVTPLMAASALPIDGKQVRIRGPLAAVANTGTSGAASSSFTMGVMPFSGTAIGVGQLPITPSDATSYEINGRSSAGSVGLGQLGGAGTLTVAYGTLVSAGAAATGSSSPTTVSFAATHVLAGSSVQGAGLDRVSGIVSARSGNTLSVEDGTLVAADGSETFMGGTTTTVNMGPNTLVTVFGQGATEIHSPQEISVGSSIDAFGVAGSQSLGSVALDASAGRVRLGTTSASGLVTALGSGTVNLGLVTLGGRAVAAFDFVGSGAAANPYVVGTGALDLTNSPVGVPVIVTGLTSSFGAAPPDFSASALLDPTTIQAELAVDWGAGTAAPFATYDGSAIDLNIRNGSIGVRHQIQVGAQAINVVGLSSDPLIVPDTTSNTVFVIGHSQSSTMENFDTYSAFITQLQAELNGTTLATGLTAVGPYAASTFTLTATSITLFLND